MKKFHYNFNGAYNKKGHLLKEIDYWLGDLVPIEAWDGDGHEITFYVNKNGCGYFIERKDGTYEQCAGTAQFRLPRSASTLRKHLRERLNMLRNF